MTLQWIHAAITRCIVLLLALGTLMPTAAQAPVDLRVALVIGNGAYSGDAALPNPPNDAAAMSQTLRALGFQVVEARDASRAQMLEAIAKVRDQLRGKGGVGMLYYAGHGLQLDWRNYMVPIDARIASAADVAVQGVDLTTVLDAFRQAGTRMNIVVLDACRDNPYAASTGKGLAPLDAPPGTFLAFATAPGNVAEDGSGQNGLYTSFLLEELKRPQARIEDVFKRVRLNVRQRSHGRQVPWESTSLEDDFSFNSGVMAVARMNVIDKERAFNQEKAEWDRIKESRSADDFYAFLKRYPSSSISEAATARLNLLTRPQVVATPLQGRQAVDYATIWKKGSSSTYQRTDTLTKRTVPGRMVTVESNDGELVEFRTLVGNDSSRSFSTVTGASVSQSNGTRFDPPLQVYPAGDAQVGYRYSSRSMARFPNGQSGWIEFDVHIKAFERVTVKLGSFSAYRIDMQFSTQSGTRGQQTWWLDPKVGLVKSMHESRTRAGVFEGYEEELIARDPG